METIELFKLPSSEQLYWTNQIAEGNWRAANYLAQILRAGTFQQRYGPDGRVLLLTDNGSLASFCTLVPQDEIIGTALLPWIGFVYTFPAYRGHRYSEKLIDKACAIANANGHGTIYLSSDEIGLYEKYGFTFYHNMTTADGKLTQVFFRNL